ncbi:MAG: DNA polymerase IV [Candidatus Omnitrophica bacterium]|nr:DNA polymerase IV [Candidatus Omnitrophota bacterium]
MEKLIVHVDMDAFFAAIEQRDNPELRGRAVVVGADPKAGKGRGVVSTCSYEARRFGIHSAMPISAAYKRCPDAAYLPVDIPKYSRVSRQIYKILYEFTPDIEPVGIDEAFLDITGSFHLFKTPLNTCLLLKAGIKEKTGLTASLGLAPTKTAAKIASDLKKPDGMVEVKPEGLLDFLWPLEIRRLWGLGAKTEQILNGMNSGAWQKRGGASEAGKRHR